MPSSLTPSPSRTLRDYTSIPFELLIAALTILPFFVLAYFYSVLPNRVPLFMQLNGEVAQWAEKTLVSVFRVPLMAVLTQIVCLLMKYGGIKSIAVAPREVELEKLDEQSVRLNAGLWDWLRWSVAFKMSAESVNTILLSFAMNSFSQPIFIVSAIAALVGVAGALFYLYRLIVLKREMKRKVGNAKPHNPTDPRHVHGGILYFNRSDSALFSQKYIFNFGNKWVWVFIACILAYPVLVFWPS